MKICITVSTNILSSTTIFNINNKTTCISYIYIYTLFFYIWKYVCMYVCICIYKYIYIYIYRLCFSIQIISSFIKQKHLGFIPPIFYHLFFLSFIFIPIFLCVHTVSTAEIHSQPPVSFHNVLLLPWNTRHRTSEKEISSGL